MREMLIESAIKNGYVNDELMRNFGMAIEQEMVKIISDINSVKSIKNAKQQTEEENKTQVYDDDNIKESVERLKKKYGYSKDKDIPKGLIIESIKEGNEVDRMNELVFNTEKDWLSNKIDNIISSVKGTIKDLGYEDEYVGGMTENITDKLDDIANRIRGQYVKTANDLSEYSPFYEGELQRGRKCERMLLLDQKQYAEFEIEFCQALDDGVGFNVESNVGDVNGQGRVCMTFGFNEKMMEVRCAYRAEETSGAILLTGLIIYMGDVAICPIGGFGRCAVEKVIQFVHKALSIHETESRSILTEKIVVHNYEIDDGQSN